MPLVNFIYQDEVVIKWIPIKYMQYWNDILVQYQHQRALGNNANNATSLAFSKLFGNHLLDDAYTEIEELKQLNYPSYMVDVPLSLRLIFERITDITSNEVDNLRQCISYMALVNSKLRDLLASPIISSYSLSFEKVFYEISDIQMITKKLFVNGRPLFQNDPFILEQDNLNLPPNIDFEITNDTEPIDEEPEENQF